jgi:CDP-4-dehydro-6-deoxyglucose reductase, E3
MTDGDEVRRRSPPAPVLTFTGRVRETRDLTYDVREIAISLVDPPSIEFLPGQFVSFEIERPGARFKMTRAYSMVSSPDTRDEIVLMLNHVSGGPGSEYLFGLSAGDTTSFRGPYGAFTLAPGGTRDLLFVASDTGIAPFRSMLEWLSHNEPMRKVTLLWGLNSERDLYYQDDLTIWRTKMPHFEAVLTLAQPEAAYSWARGSVDALVSERVNSVDNLEVFICGGSAMIAAVSAIIKSKGLCPIRREQYYVDKAK